MLNGWNSTVRTTSAINSASMMTLTVSHQPSSFLTGVTAASAGFRLGSIIRVKTPFLVHRQRARRGPLRLVYKGGKSAPSKPAGGARTWRKQGRGVALRHEDQGAGGLALLKGDMSLSGVRQRPLPADLDLDLAAADHAEQI